MYLEKILKPSLLDQDAYPVHPNPTKAKTKKSKEKMESKTDGFRSIAERAAR